MNHLLEVAVPRGLWNEIRECLEKHRYIDLGDDEDNDEEVIGLLRRMDEVD